MIDIKKNGMSIRKKTTNWLWIDQNLLSTHLIDHWKNYEHQTKDKENFTMMMSMYIIIWAEIKLNWMKCLSLSSC